MDSTAPQNSTSTDWIALVREKVDRIRFGIVQLVVHDGRVTQIECTEKTRLASTQPPSLRQS